MVSSRRCCNLSLLCLPSSRLEYPVDHCSFPRTAFGEEAGGFGWSLSSSLPSVTPHCVSPSGFGADVLSNPSFVGVVGSLASHCRGNRSFFTNSCALTEDVPGAFVYSFLRYVLAFFNIGGSWTTESSTRRRVG
ncbi:hypothetical protein DY000_02016574 [Brassica cretica]|uniref:Secreted protein n=1 Tax=Brassica cretica TaxID=69181 RepID=A0ABQ7CR32_BRACR|nr:hypothetical protein DY000_02016574 [Brassica cretica]